MAGEIVTPEQLDLMDPGTVSLGVPMLRGILQINAVKIDATARIRVEKTESDLTIVREDGHPLQIHARYSSTINRPPWFETVSRLVFEEPTPVVKLTRHPSHARSWQMGRDMPGCHRDAAAEFLSTVGVYARMKQAKTRGQSPSS